MFRQFKRLYPYLWRYHWPVAVGLACLVFTNYLDIRVAVMLGHGIDLINFDFGRAAQRGQFAMLNLFALIVLTMAVGSAVARFWMRQLIIGASRQVEYAFRNDFFAQLQRLSATFYDRYRTGDIMSRATSDMEAIRTVIGPAIMYLANTAAILPMTLVQMIHISGKLTLLCWLPMILIAPLFYFFSRRIHRRFRRVQELMSDLSANIQENLAGVRVIKTYAHEPEQARDFDALSQRYVDENLSLARLQSVFIPMLTLIVGLALLMLLWGGSWLIIHNQLSIGALVSFFVMLMASIWPLAALGWVMAQLERGSASMARVEEIFRLAPAVADGPSTVTEPPELRGRIELRDLTFSFPNAERPALRHLTLDLPAGATLGLTGPVGSGKSTLASLIVRRYNPPRGTLLIDGIDVLDWPVEALRSRIGIVDQEPFLFSDSIEANLAFGLDGQPGAAERAREAARIAQFDREIEIFPLGYETLLGERGINLSGGQRQRAALARAIAREPAILILDDSLAAVDTQTEEAILRGLSQVMAERTTILISHRISTVSMANLILYLDAGRVVEQGTHDELLAARGAYWRLAQRQRLAEEIERTA